MSDFAVCSILKEAFIYLVVGGGQGGAPQRLAYLRELRFCPMEVCLWGERCREGRAQVSAREGFILG